MRPSASSVIVAVALLTASGSPSQAQSSNAFDDFDAGLEDGAYLGLVLPLNLGLSLNQAPANRLQTPPPFDLGVRDALVWERPEAAATFSDVLLYSLVVGVLAAPPLGEWSRGPTELRAMLVGAEALATTSFITGIFKYLTGRRRPYAEIGGLDEGYSSFFSGHTSMTFSAATLLTLYSIEFDWLGDDTRWIIPTSAFLLAATTGYLRMASDRHWLTDVLIGAVVGTSTAYLTFAIRTGG